MTPTLERAMHDARAEAWRSLSSVDDALIALEAIAAVEGRVKEILAREGATP